MIGKHNKDISGIVIYSGLKTKILLLGALSGVLNPFKPDGTLNKKTSRGGRDV